METNLQKILRLREAGLSYEDIALEVPCAISTVWYYLTPGAKENRKKRSVEFKASFVSDLKKKHGGRCALCGYSKCLQALDFHHLGHEGKDANVSRLAQSGSFPKARREAEKCLLVCSNCHREIHAGLLNISGIGGLTQNLTETNRVKACDANVTT